MDRWRFGRAIRALRRRRTWTQSQLAARCQLSRSTVSRIETGRIDRIAFADLETIAVALDGRLDLDFRWRGATLDRLIDERHAAVVDATVRWLRSGGWDVAVEASFAIYAERGSIDVFGRHPDGPLLMVEVKASIGDVNQTLIGIDRKTRLAPEIARLRGWPAGPVAALLVVAEGTTNRARITRHADAFGAALPASAQDCRAWVRRPDGPPPRGIVFVRLSTGLATGRAGPAHRRLPTR